MIKFSFFSTIKFVIAILVLSFTMSYNNSAKACEGGTLVDSITPTGVWQLQDSIYAGGYYIFEATTNDVILLSFCQAGAFYENNPMIEIYPTSGTQASQSNDDFCGYGSELIFICEASGTYKISFFQSGCIADGAELGTVAYKLVPTPTVQDCIGAIPLCTEYYEDTVSVSGSGNYYDLFNFYEQDSMSATTNNCPNCLVNGELNAKWFSFGIYEPGLLLFNIDPYNDLDDYDWALFKLSDTIGCEYLINASDYPPLSCNFSYIDSQPGNTGIGGGTSSCEGPTADDGFNSALNVYSGEEYVLVVSNYSSTQGGFSINFSASSANIIDTTLPQISNIIYDLQCGSSIINLQFSENILCSEVQPTDFVISGPNGICQIANVYSNIGVASSVNTYSGIFYDEIWTLVLDEPLSTTGTYRLQLLPNQVSDNCLNTNLYQEIIFNIDCIDDFTLSVNTIGEGIVDVDGLPQSDLYVFTEGAEVPLTAIPDAGWQFDSWSGDLSGNNISENILIDSDKVTTAVFVEIPPVYDTLTIFVEGSGYVNVDENLYAEPVLFEQYSLATLYAVANEGWQFDHWEDSLSGSVNPIEIILDNNKFVTAVFSEIPQYYLNIVTTGQGSIDINGSIYESPMLIEEGNLITITAIPNENYIFQYWTGDLEGNLNPESFIMQSEKNIEAVFYNISFTQQKYFNDLKVLPNPFSESIKISGNDSGAMTSYEIYNASGSLVLKGVFYDNIEISTQHLKPAVYRLNICTEEITTYYKIIKIE